MARAWLALTAVLAAACGDNAMSTRPDVHGLWEARRHTDTGDVVLPVDLSARHFQVLVRGPDDYAVIEGVTSAVGTFDAEDVPADGTVALRFDDFFLITTAREAHFIDDAQGRRGWTSGGPGTVLSLELDGLRPWVQGDDLALYSPGSSTEAPYLVALADAYPVETGVTTTGALEVDWEDLPLSVAALGDVTHVVQYGTEFAPSGQLYQRVAGYATCNCLSQTSGTTSSLALTLDEPAQTGQIALTGRVSELARIWHEAVPEDPSTPINVALGLFAQPGAVSNLYTFDFMPAVVREIEPETETDIDLGPLSYGDPYPAEWKRFVGLAAAYRGGNYTAPGATIGNDWYARLTRLVPLEEYAPPINPTISPVRNVAIAGVPATSMAPELEAVGETPMVTWDAPALGTASAGYLVTVWRIGLAADGVNTTMDRAGVLLTSSPGFLTPPDLLTAGEHYAFQIRAVDADLPPLVANPNAVSTSSAGADYYTAMFTP